MKKVFLLLVLSALMAQPAFSLPILWTDWQSATTGTPGSATGVIDGIGVSYTGELVFAQLGTGTNYWTEGDPAPYTGNAVVDNAPTPAEMLALSNAFTANTLTFSQAIWNPIMAIVSQGRLNLPVSYDFDAPFTVLSEGAGYWGDGTYTLDTTNYILTGYELHAAIQFQGWHESITWSSSPNEYWHGITVGVPVPEPSTFLMLGAGMFGLALAGHRLRRKK